MGQRPPNIDELRRAVRPPVNVANVRSLLEAGVDPNGFLRSGPRPLYEASFCCEAEAVSLLLEYGADPNFEEPGFSMTPLMTAASRGKDGFVCIEHLLRAKADVNKANGEGFTPLIFAIRSSSIEAVKVLLRAGANPNAQTTGGRPALYWAIVDRDNDEIVAALLKAGANKSIKVGIGGDISSLANIAEERGWLKSAQLLR